jgi:arylsulfatase A-like enzyme
MLNDGISRRKFLKAFGCGSSGMFLTTFLSGCTKSLPKPNIIFILADDLGYGDLGCYGQETIKTPRLDQMAAEGMRFTDHYAGSTVCAPSRCCLMTGLHTGHALVRDNARLPLRPSDVTVTELLKQTGYTTALIGKWGLGNPGTTGIPNKKGFDYFFGYLDQGHAHNYYPSFLFRNEERVLLRNIVPDETETGRGVATERVDYSHDIFTEEALSFVKKNKNQSFFLYLAYTIPHANNEGGRKTGDGMEIPDYGEYAEENWPNQEKGRAAMISRLDRDVGRLLDELRSSGLDKNTVVFFSSDNGPHREGGSSPEFFKSSGPLRGIKRDLYEGGIRVPLITWWPGKIKAGSESSLMSAFWDFLPTASDLAKISVIGEIDGISFLPTILGKDINQKKHDYLYWEFPTRSAQAVRMGDWKGIRFGTKSEIELYNLKSDLSENTDVADKHPEIVTEIAEIMDLAHNDSENFPLREFTTR